jgi:lactoylglutathione lyase
MIKGLFETHIRVRDLSASTAFYNSLPGLELATFDEKRGIAFFWVGGPGQSMLGLWETEGYIQPQHFAFRVDEPAMEGPALDLLRTQDRPCYNFLDDGTREPMVFAWMPAVSIYFRDPDNHELEFIAMLKGMPRPEYGVISLREWERVNSF